MNVAQNFACLPILPEATRESVAFECRAAALSLLAGIRKGWGKVELARWLAGPYAWATRHVPRDPRPKAHEPWPTIAEADVHDCLTRVRIKLVASLERAVLEHGLLDFVGQHLRRGLVVQTVDARGVDVWVPRDVVRLGLYDRVRALFAADSMNDPGAYETLFVCHRCEDVVFDEIAKGRGVCRRHRPLSGFEVAVNDCS